MTKLITEDELDETIKRILKEAETQAKFNGIEFVGLSEDEIGQKVFERLGNDWELQKCITP